MTPRLETPVAMLVFNRPDTTERVFAEVAKARPSRLIVVADGPRPDRPGEAELCAATRAIFERIDWECELTTEFAETNMGLRRRVSSGLDRVFDLVEEAIILEDDCLPHPSFFRFCQELLELYRDDERIAQISGDNFQSGRHRTGDSYYFSRYNHIWGWATWRRSWRHYDVTMSRWPEFRDGGWLRDYLRDERLLRYWTQIFDRTHAGVIHTWDYQWTFSCWLQNTLTILPSVNLISNIGFRPDATHTRSDSVLANLPVSAMEFPLTHPFHFHPDTRADEWTAQSVFLPPSLSMRIARRLGLGSDRP